MKPEFLRLQLRVKLGPLTNSGVRYKTTGKVLIGLYRIRNMNGRMSYSQNIARTLMGKMSEVFNDET